MVSNSAGESPIIIGYRLRLICYTRLGQPAKALITYQRCRHTFLSHLGTSPSQEIQLLYQSLTTDLRTE
ncbi:bacterial transcriptional activator domain-containing protein [Nitrosomonas sp. H1_AOB3]|uniref:bacterial transcriptional activator domain-containing protein n=1 Tax=Nitrosomonas sp. H1_AOB3 TaxID=2741553 RepID=UPI0033903A41